MACTWSGVVSSAFEDNRTCGRFGARSVITAWKRSCSCICSPTDEVLETLGELARRELPGDLELAAEP